MNNRGFTLVSTMVTLVIIAMLSVVFMYGSGAFQKGGPKSSRADGRGTTIPGAAEMAARDTACRSNLTQVRESLEIVQGGNEEHPASLAETKLSPDFMSCPIGHEPYVYDPTTGLVHCPHPGHEKY